MLQRFSFSLFTVSKISGVIATEISNLRVDRLDKQFVLDGFSDNNMIFTLYQIDHDASGEDVYGWRYKCGDQKLLIIND